MNNNNRSNNYDWFKGKNSPEKRSKNNLKSAWKITRILIYLSLFVFTMTGCVQIFVIKTDNGIGNGIEFYTSDDEVSPHVTKFNITHSVTDKSEDIYGINLESKSPVWVNNKKTLIDIKKELINGQGIGKLTDAARGINESISFQGNGVIQKADWDNEHSIEVDSNNKPVVWSSATKKITKSVTSKKMSDLGERYFVFNNKSYKLNFGFFDGNQTIAGTQDVSKESIMSINALNAFASKGLAKIDPNDSNKMISNGTVYDYIESNISSTKPVANANNVIVENIKRDSAQSMILNMMKYIGVQLTLPPMNITGEAIIQTSFTRGYIPGMGTTKTNYRPMVTWGDAWQRGPFYGIFVYPIAKVAVHMIASMGDLNGWEMILTIFLVVWLIRAITFGLSFKSVLQQTKMQEIQGKKAVIDAKYAAYKGNKQMETRKSQEIQELYKKEGISMFGSIGSIFLTMPFFLAIWRVIGAIPHIKSAEWAGISFPATSYKELFTGEWQYLPLLILAAAFAAGQQIVPRLLTSKRNNTRINAQQKAAMKKNNKTQNIMMVVFVIMAVIFNAGLQLYWIAGGIWMIAQSIATHHFIVWQSKNKRRKKIKA